jgi:PilZ domain
MQNAKKEEFSQRTNIRMDLPISIMVQNTRLKVIDWSHSGVAFNSASLAAKQVRLQKEEIIDAELLFEFEGFSLRVPLQCEVRYVNGEATRVGCKFYQMDKRNIQIMQYLVKAYLSGKLEDVGDLLDVGVTGDMQTKKKTFRHEIVYSLLLGAIICLAFL